MSDEPTRRSPGRPSLDGTDRSVPLNVSLSAKQLADVTDHAKHDRMTVQDWIRKVLRHATDRE
jgi:hypothetical protein